MNSETMKELAYKYWIFILYALGGIVQIALLVSQSKQEFKLLNTVITILFFAVILVVYIVAFLNFNKARAFRKDLNDASQMILSMIDNEGILDELFNREVFKTAILKSAFDAYKQDVTHMRKFTPDAEVDIENYINQELLEKNMSMHYLNQIPGAMTGMGILGTFLGLSIGLSNFNFTGSSDIATEIQPLMDGIKVAFHTSIVGLIYSLGFNVCYRHQLADDREELEQFLAAFRQYVVPVSEDGNAGSFAKYQQKMVEILESQKSIYLLHSEKELENQTQLIELTVKQNEISEAMSKQMVKEITALLQDIVVPEIQSISVAVAEFAEEAKKDQKDGLEKIVNSFIEQMNTSLGDSFGVLAKVIDDTNEWQRKSLGEMQNVLTEINTMAVDLAAINKSIEESTDNVRDCSDKVKILQNEVVTNLDKLNSQAENSNELLKNGTALLVQLRTNEDQLNVSMSGFLDRAKELSTAIQSMNADLNVRTETEIHQIIELAEASNEKIRESAVDTLTTLQSMEDRARAASEQATQQFTIAAMAELDNVSKTAAVSMNNIAIGADEELRKITDLVASSNEKMTVTTDGVAKAMKEMTAQVCNDSEQSTKMIVDTSMAGTADIVNTSIEGIKNIQAMITEQMNLIRESFGEINQQNNENTFRMIEDIRQMSIKITELSEENIKKITALAESAENNTTELVKSHLNTVQEISADNRDNLEKSYGEMEAVLKKKVDQMIHLNDSITADINKAAISLGETARSMDGKFQNSLKETLRSFDEQLAEATSHLAGTLGSMETSMKKITMITKNNDDAIESQFLEMQRLLDQYLEYADKLHRNLENKWRQWEKEEQGR